LLAETRFRRRRIVAPLAREPVQLIGVTGSSSGRGSREGISGTSGTSNRTTR
jgi:hypothetical protein